MLSFVRLKKSKLFLSLFLLSLFSSVHSWAEEEQYYSCKSQDLTNLNSAPGSYRVTISKGGESGKLFRILPPVSGVASAPELIADLSKSTAKNDNALVSSKEHATAITFVPMGSHGVLRLIGKGPEDGTSRNSVFSCSRDTLTIVL